MKKLLFILFICSSFVSPGQTYRNSWINYNQTYYKFKIGTDGIYRIPYSTLQAAGLNNIPAEQFQLWRNGEEQRIYTSTPSGLLGSGDYIEFFGLKNDGKPDTKLYRDPDFQLTDKNSIFSDTSSYFLTVNVGSNARFSTAVNDVAGNVLPVEKYFMNTVGRYLQTQMNPGYSIPVGGVYLYSSSYDQAEGWSGKIFAPNSNENGILGGLNIYPAGPDATIRFAAAGSAFNSRNVKLTFGNNLSTSVVSNDPMPNMDYVKKSIPFSIALLNGNPNWASYKFESTSTVSTDRMVVSFIEFTYPSSFNFNNNTFQYFELSPSVQGNYLEITNFNTGGVAPVLYDYTTGKRYIGDISTPGKIKFALPPSATQQKFRLISQNVNSITTISNLTQRNFIDYSQSSNQGDFIIITNPVLYNSTAGNNYVDEYRQYRSSAQGGGFRSIIVDINEITDQFAYGIDKHPISIKEFIQFAKAKFNPAAKYVFIIGKGLSYDEYVKNRNSIYAEKLNLVPTFGAPASDVLLASPYGITTPSIPIGRLSAISGDEVGNYLEKMKEYEGEQQSTLQTTRDKLWMKNVVQIVGGKDSSENGTFRNYMYGYKNILRDTALGAHVELFSKTSNSAVQLISSQRIEQLFEQGIGILSYFGHSSANTLEYNLSDPQAYNNPSKYPFFIVSGCTAGNNYVFDTLRFITGRKTISEDFVLSKRRGSISFLASTHYGIPPYLDEYNRTFYNLVASQNYGAPVGDQMKKTIEELDGNDPNLYFFNRADLEEMALNGDPALKIHSQPKPDYVVEDDLIKIDPPFISVANQKFSLNVKTYNLGKAVGDSIYLEIKRTFPNGSVQTIYNQKILAPYYSDSLTLSVPVISSNDKGLNKITVTIDAGNDVDEMSEANNSFTKQFYIFEDEASPAYPQNFAIINNNTQKLYASTANPLSELKSYVFQIDTTEKFNSALLVNKTVSGKGGVLEFDPGFAYTDSTVYYWRVAVQTDTTTPDNYRWNGSSFIYLAGSSLGSNQSDYYQHLYSDTQNIRLNGNRNWQYSSVTNVISSRGGVFPTAWQYGSEYSSDVNGAQFVKSVCGISGIVFNVLNPVTLKPWFNTKVVGRFGSDPVCADDRMANFQFNILSQSKREAAYHFLKDSIPPGYVVIVRNISGTVPSSNTYASDWMGDTSFLGSGNSLYHQLFNDGFTLIDSFNRPKGFIFMYQKDNPDFIPTFVFSKGLNDKIELSHNIIAPDSLGYIQSPRFGPATSWKELHWDGVDEGSPHSDHVLVDVIGITNEGVEAKLFTADSTAKDADISFIDAKTYPYLSLRMRNEDSIHFSPFQLKYWRLNYQPVPEGALTPTLLFKTKDTLVQGEKLDFEIAFKNISPEAFDSLKINVTVIDSRNVSHVIPVPRQKPLVSGDTVSLRLSIDTKEFSGLNTLFVDFNPDYDQPEVYHYNNFIYQNFFVKSDLFNPLLDVTFDGIHILNRDIVSSKPHIVIKLKDESEYMKLSDTSLITVQLRYPDGIIRDIKFDNDTLRFTPATGAENTATIDYTPSFFGDDDEYELIVSGKDVVGNKSGALNYHVTFRVISKPMISNFLNYPNPFTTSTAFVFTITGSEVPQNIRIQILTVTGKVVREITRQELGPLNIGRNITEFKWDGTDMYGQKLANGVYLYRVLTNLNGKSMDAFGEANESIRNGDGKKRNGYDFFIKGYGKMYLMR